MKLFTLGLHEILSGHMDAVNDGRVKDAAGRVLSFRSGGPGGRVCTTHELDDRELAPPLQGYTIVPKEPPKVRVPWVVTQNYDGHTVTVPADAYEALLALAGAVDGWMAGHPEHEEFMRSFPQIEPMYKAREAFTIEGRKP